MPLPMPPPSPVLPTLTEHVYGGASAAGGGGGAVSVTASQSAAQLRSLHSAALVTMHHPFSTERKNGISPARSRPGEHPFLHQQRSPQPSPQDYPVFTPVKNYEEFLLGNSIPPDSSCKSDESIEALRDEEMLSPLVLDRTDSHGFNLGAPVHPFRKAAVRLVNAKLAPAAASRDALIRKKIESRPHHITSIHPNRGPTAGQFRPRNRSEEFCRQQLRAEWEASHALMSKKPLSEFLTEIAAKKIQNTLGPPPSERQIGFESAIGDLAPKKKASGPDYNDISGCLTCDKCLPGSRVTVVPLMDSRDYTEVPPKDRDFTETLAPKTKTGNNLMSWFRSKKKPTDSHTPVLGSRERMAASKAQSAMEKEKVTCALHNTNVVKEKPSGTSAEEEKDMEMAMKSLKLEVSQANQKRDAALVEVFELKLAIEEMGKKLGHLESYCQSLHPGGPKKPDAMISMTAGLEYDDQKGDDDDQIPRLSPGNISQSGPSKEEFYHAVTEARIGVKQFCRTLLQQIQEQSAIEKIETILQPYNVKVAPRVSKCVRYHIESLINQAFYEDFENVKFQRSGTNCVLDPRQRPQAFYKTYLTISQMGWSELVTKESSAYSESFDGFCDHKMNRVEEVLNWDGRWPDELARAFFVAAKWVWLLHLLAFSFEQPATIFRVGSEAHFDPQYMEELPVDQSSKSKQQLQYNHGGGGVIEAGTQIRAMVMPGFFFNTFEIIKCKVMLSRQPFTTS